MSEKSEKRVSLEAVIATALLKAHVEQKPVTVEDISKLLMDPAIEPLLAGADIKICCGHCENVSGIINGWCLAGFARRGKKGSIELLPDGIRLCFLILRDEAQNNPAAIDFLAAAEALELMVSDLLRCLEEEWLQSR